jgi:hypothetical protein
VPELAKGFGESPAQIVGTVGEVDRRERGSDGVGDVV